MFNLVRRRACAHLRFPLHLVPQRDRAHSPSHPRFPEPSRNRPPQEILDRIAAQSDSLSALIDQIRARPPLDPRHPDDEIADVAIFEKAARWITRHDEFFKPDEPSSPFASSNSATTRARQLLDNKQPWRTAPGSNLRGYVSRIDRSVQPFAVYAS